MSALGVACVLMVSVGHAYGEGRSIGPVYRTVDRVTGATIELYRPAGDRAIVDVRTPRLTIRKIVSTTVAETRLTGSGEDLTITLDRSGVVVVDGRLGLRASGDTAAGLERARARLQASGLVRDALALLGRLEARSGSPISHTLLVTEAMLQSAVGDPDAGRRLEAWALRPHGRVRTLPVTWQDGQEELVGPTECWDEYVAEAIAAWIEYEQCVDATEWWDAPGLLACLAIYDMRAIGAFSWWVSCVGFRG